MASSVPKIRDVEDIIDEAEELAREVSRLNPSRELSLTITKLQEAAMWAALGTLRQQQRDDRSMEDERNT